MKAMEQQQRLATENREELGYSDGQSFTSESVHGCNTKEKHEESQPDRSQEQKHFTSQADESKEQKCVVKNEGDGYEGKPVINQNDSSSEQRNTTSWINEINEQKQTSSQREDECCERQKHAALGQIHENCDFEHSHSDVSQTDGNDFEQKPAVIQINKSELEQKQTMNQNGENENHTHVESQRSNSRERNGANSQNNTKDESCAQGQWGISHPESQAQNGWGKAEDASDSSDTTGDDDEEVDPRVAENLEIMNQSCADVNKLENELDEARSKYRSTFQAASQRMEELGGKIKKSIQRARPYFELTEKAKEAQNEAVRAARKYQKANSNYRAAKEMITLAEQSFADSECQVRNLSSAWQETLNHATVKVMESEKEKTRSEAEHNERAAIFARIEAQLHYLEKKYRRSITKARPYFETKAELELKLQQLKQNVWDLQHAISIRKARYAEALRCLEAVSTEIHESRRSRQKLMLQFPREPGVGAETDSLGSSISDVNIERGMFSSTASYDDNEDDESDDGNDVFHPGRPGFLRRERAHSKSSNCSAQGQSHRRSASSASGSVFSSDGTCDSQPQSPTSDPDLAVVSSPVGGFSGAVSVSTCSPSSQRPRLIDLARGEMSDAAGKRTGNDDVIRKATGGGCDDTGSGATDDSRSLPLEDQRVAGDGSSSSHDDCPQEETGSVDTHRDPDSHLFTQSPSSLQSQGKTQCLQDNHASSEPSSVHAQNTNGLRAADNHQRSGSPSNHAQGTEGFRYANSSPRSGSPSPLISQRAESPLRGIPEKAPPSATPSLTSQGVNNGLSVVAADSNPCFNTGLGSEVPVNGQVTKQPLKRTDGGRQKPLQGMMLLNPSDLASSSFQF